MTRPTVVVDVRLKSFLDGLSDDDVRLLQSKWLDRPKRAVDQRHRDMFADDIEDRLAWLMLAESDGRRGFMVGGIRTVEPLDVGVSCDEMTTEDRVRRLADSGSWLSDDILFPDIKPTDVGELGLHHQSMLSTGDPNMPYVIQATLQAAKHAWRGLGAADYKWMYYQSGILNTGAYVMNGGAMIGWSRQFGYVVLGDNRINPQKRRTCQDIVVRALNALLERRYNWRVVMGFRGHPKLSVETNPAGVRHLYADRDAGTSGRRSALRHWVQQHWRSRDSDAGDLIWVREHLRGSTEFTWRGLECKVAPSLFDIERAARAQMFAMIRRGEVDGIAAGQLTDDEMGDLFDRAMGRRRRA